MAEEQYDDYLPTLDLNQVQDGESFRVYFQSLRESVSRETYVKKTNSSNRMVDVRLQRVLRRKKKRETIANKLQFLPVRYLGHELEIIMYPLDLYIFGIKNKNTCFILTTSSSTTEMEEVKLCIEHHKFEVVFIELDYSYPALEMAAGLKRSQIKIGRPTLVEAVVFLSGLGSFGTDDIDNHLGPIALHVLCLTQIFCEAVRIKILKNTIIENFVHGKVLGVLLIILEHGWAIASRRLLRKEESKSNLEVYYSDNTDDPLTIEDLNNLYDVLKYYKKSDLNKTDKASELEMVMTRLFLHSYLGKHIKSARVILETEAHYDVQAVKHTFHDENIVLQYNHKDKNAVEPSSSASLVQYLKAIDGHDIPAVSVLVNADEDYFIEIMEPPLTSLPEKSFTSFSKESGVASVGTFTNTLIYQAEDEKGKTSYELEDLKVVAMDYISKSGPQGNFDDNWERLDNEVVGDYILGVKTLRNAVDEALQFFDMHPCESFEPGDDKRKKRRERARGIQENATEHSFALSGKYMGTMLILLKAKFNVEETMEGEQETKVVMVQLQVRSEQRFGSEYVHKAVEKGLGIPAN